MRPLSLLAASRVFVIAEIASSHEGDPDLARRLIRLAATTGADAVKLQIFRRDALLSVVHPKYPNFGIIEMVPAAWTTLLAEAGTAGIRVVVEPFDEASLDLAAASGVPTAYKLPTSDISNRRFVEAVAATGQPVILGVGGATEAEIAQAIDWLRGRAVEVVLMHGFQSYPTRPEDTHLARLRWLGDHYALPTAFADHVDAEDAALRFVLPLMAVGAGARVIEKHITDDRSRKGRDHYSALNPSEFADFVALLRRLEPALGQPCPGLTEAELRYRHEMKRQAVAARPLAAGTALTADMLAFKRTGEAGLGHHEATAWLGKALRVDRSTDDPIRAADF